MSGHKLFIVCTIFFFLTGFDITLSQSKLQIGFDIRDEYIRKVYIAVIKTEYNTDYTDFLFEFPAIDFLALYKISKYYSLEFNIGYDFLNILIPVEYGIIGPNLGLSVKRKILNNWLDGKLNFNLLFNRGSRTLPMIGLGFDIYTSDDIAFNLMFVKLLKEKVADSKPDKSFPDKVFGEIHYPYLIKFGFSFYWDIL